MSLVTVVTLRMHLRMFATTMLSCLWSLNAFSQGVILQAGGPGHAWPRYGYGYTATWTTDFQTVTLSNPDGTRRWSVPLSIPNVRASVVLDAAICPGGVLILATTLTSANGQMVAANVRMDPYGVVTDVTRTSPYASRRLACTPSGSIWSVGAERDSTGKELAEYAVIRRYSAAGVQEAELLPRSQADAPLWHPAERAYLRADDDGFVLVSTKIGRLYTGSSRASVVKSVPFAPPAGCSEITGVALVKDTILVSCEKSSYPDPNGETAFSLATLDRVSGTVLKPLVALTEPTAILGSDGGRAILFRTKGRLLTSFNP